MERKWKVLSAVAGGATLLVASAVVAQSGHFLTGGGNDVTCTDTGTQVRCVGKVAGLGGTTFEITVESEGLAEVECINPAGNRAPGQDTEVDAEGGTGPQPTPRNGQFRFNLATVSPDVPNVPTCPNPQWDAVVVDVEFGPATISLFEDDVLVDQITVNVD
ncbi:hypothetical protein [Sandaracinus amylolyticus]|uniref:hypothetical protein n=1 Tax=Sandaracinus amylolyticus TaxID=927083 RepID=UPI001F32EFAB|nr:hypothetical protein [Sandaracinus amylolyticus]UJR85609.1 Hypothetical protein I5071_76890 [Sandaracinus amylolyticus]